MSKIETLVIDHVDTDLLQKQIHDLENHLAEMNKSSDFLDSVTGIHNMLAEWSDNYTMPTFKTPKTEPLWKQYGSKDIWDHHPSVPRYCWEAAVASGCTNLGYWEWVTERLTGKEGG